MKSSISYQMALHLGSYAIASFVVVEFALMLYKTVVLPYPALHFCTELVVLLALSVCEAMRVFLAWKGNLTESAGSVLAAIVMCVPGVIATVYFLIWQTYVLRLEVVLCGLVLSIQGLHLVLSVVCLITFYSSSV